MLKAIVFNDTSYEKHHGSQLVMRQLLLLAAEAGIQVVRSCPMRYDWRSDARLCADIAAADLCIINGEGTMHDDAPQAVRLAGLAPFCREHGTACFLINSVWQRNTKATELARDFTAIYLRDELSRQDIERQGLQAKVVPDLTLSHEPVLPAVQRSGWLVNGSVFIDRVVEAWRAMQAQRDPQLRFLSIKAMPVIQRGKGFPLFFFKSLSRWQKAWRERAAGRRVNFASEISPSQVRDLRWASSASSLDDFLRQLASSEGTITGRFHCVTLCMITGTPVYAIGSNTHKIESLLAEAGLHGRIFQDYTSALEQRDKMQWTAEEQASLQAFVAGCRQRARTMFAEIVQLTHQVTGK